MINAREISLRQYKNKFSIKFAEIMSKQQYEWKNIQKDNRWSLISLGSIGFYLITGLAGFIPGKHEHGYDLETHCYIAVGAVIFAIYVNIYITNKWYQNAIKSVLFPQLVKVFGDEIYYNAYKLLKNISTDSLLTDTTSNLISEEYDFDHKWSIPNNMFETCQLYQQEITYRDDDDIFYGKYNGVDFIIDETDFGGNSNDKHRTYHRMFKGVAMHFKMNKVIKNRVLITSKGVFNHIPKGFEKVDVEYNKFSNKYVAYVNGGDTASAQIEARYLLNVAFLDRFMQLHTSFASPKIQCSVYGNDLLVMLSTNKDLFEVNHLLGKIDDIKQYNHLFDEFASVLSFIDVLNLSSKTGL